MVNELMDIEGKCPEIMRATVVRIEDLIKAQPGCIGADEVPLLHSLESGYYLREVTVPKDFLISTALHKVHNVLFLLTGECSVLDHTGVKRIKAPFYAMTQPGTKRIIYAHEDCRFVTVHRTDQKDIESVIKDVVSDGYDAPNVTDEQLKLLMGG